MTIDSATLMWSRRGASRSVDEKGRNYTTRFFRTYQVVHSADASDTEILGAVPSLMSTLTDGTITYTNVFLRDHSIAPAGPIMTYVQCDYEGQTGREPTDDPTLQEPEIEWYNLSSDEPIDIDADGLPFTNVNGELVDGQTKRISDFVLSVKRNYLGINTALTAEYLDSVNSDLFAAPGGVWLPGTCALDTFRARPINMQSGVPSYWEVSATVICRIPYLTIPARAWWARYRNEGFYARSGALVSFSGGGGTGAAGYAVEASGVITGVVVTTPGRGYTSAPTVSITGTGSGATATATLDSDGGVASVAVGSGGSGYKTSLKRAVDSNKEPVSTPVLLKANGQQEPNLANAIFIERRIKQYAKPYSVLGLF